MIRPPREARGEIDSGVQVRVERADADVSLLLQHAFFVDIAARYPGWEPASSQSVEPPDLAPPAGIWLVAYRDGHAIGCSGLQRLDSDLDQWIRPRRMLAGRCECSDRGRGCE